MSWIYRQQIEMSHIIPVAHDRKSSGGSAVARGQHDAFGMTHVPGDA
jgi:hypothetical protein